MRPRLKFRNDGGSPGVGSASMILIFAVLCLTVFALLTLSTARADHLLSQSSVQAVEAYYAADSQAEEIVAEIRAALVAGLVPPTESGGIAVQAAADRYSYQVPISDQQALQVELSFTAGGDYQVLCWKAVSTVEWQADDSLNVWDGETVF